MLYTVLFALLLMMIAPSARARLGAAMSASLDWISRYQPFSSVLILALIGAGAVAVVMVRNAPERVEPPNPMAKYRDEEVLNDEHF
jgi:hypothetical protein